MMKLMRNQSTTLPRIKTKKDSQKNKPNMEKQEPNISPVEDFRNKAQEFFKVNKWATQEPQSLTVTFNVVRVLTRSESKFQAWRLPLRTPLPLDS